MRLLLTAVLGMACTLGPVVAEGKEPQSLDDCDALVLRSPDDHTSYACYWAQARRTGRWDDAAARLDARLALEPDNHTARQYLAAIEADRGRDRAESLFREAAEGHTAAGNLVAAIHARLRLSFFLARRGRLDDADTELDLALPLAEELGDPGMLARVVTRQATQANRREDFGRALRLLARAEGDVFPDGSTDIKSVWLSAKGYACWSFGRGGEAMDAYRREAELLHEKGQLFEEAVPRRNMLFVARAMGLPLEERRELARQALEAARAGGNRRSEAWLHFDLSTMTEGAEQLEHARTALALAREMKDRGAILQGLQALAQATIETDPSEAFRALDEANDLARRSGQPSELARNLVVRARLRWETGPREQAVADYEAAFDAIEAARNLQPDGNARAMLFGSWGRAYSELASHFFSEGDEEAAFAVAERRRARTMLDRLDAAQASGAVVPDVEAAEERAAVLGEISHLQRRLVEGGLSDAEIDGVLADLRRLELDEADLRDRLARADPAFAALRRPLFPSLTEIRDALGEDQAMLYYQIASLDDEDHSWVVAITGDGARSHRLPPTSGLESAVRLFLGLFERRNGSEEAASARLHDDWLREALDGLPSRVRRLVVVSDGAMNHLPFGALRSSRSGELLAERYEISVAPSAATWLRWQRDGGPVAELPVLALVDPELPAVDATPDFAGERESILATAAGLGRLAHARREGRAVVRHMGSASVLLDGPEATEHRIKSSDLTRYGVIHLAAHALVDEENPERSAIVLGAGAASEDGLLQIREIVELDLSGRVVVLSACRSAYGPVIGGEGVMDVARAFFLAGASTVVGSLWPLRDEEAASLFDGFYRHVARGESVAGAIAATERELIRAGVPTAAWAGVVVLGNGDAVPLPGGSDRRWPWLPAIIALIVVASILVVGRAIRRVSRDDGRPRRAGGRPVLLRIARRVTRVRTAVRRPRGSGWRTSRRRSRRPRP